jgi:hypothetical protein
LEPVNDKWSGGRAAAVAEECGGVVVVGNGEGDRGWQKCEDVWHDQALRPVQISAWRRVRGKRHAKEGVMEVKWLVEDPVDFGVSMIKVSGLKGSE